MNTKPFLLVILSIITMASCTYSTNAFDSVSCESGNVDPSGDRTCIEGFWVDREAQQDAGQMDMGADLDDMETPDACMMKSEATLCREQAWECGRVSVTECGESREISCGECAPNEICQNRVCQECVPLTADQACARVSAQCGEITLQDNGCGDTETFVCPDLCASSLCSPDNLCEVCEPPVPLDFCRDQAQINGLCGEVTALDRCNQKRTEQCGQSCGDESTCLENGMCCIPETDTALCLASTGQCGSLSVMDQCGTLRVIECGPCLFTPPVVQTTSGGPVDFPAATPGIPGGTMNDLKLWLRAQTGITLDASGEISAWEDASSNSEPTTLSSSMLPQSSAQTLNGHDLVSLPGQAFIDVANVIDSNASIIFVFSTTDTTMSSVWWKQAALLSAEVDGPAKDFGVTMNMGEIAYFHDGSDNAVVSTTQKYNDGSFHLLVVTREASSGQVVIFLDGARLGRGMGQKGKLNASTTLRIGLQSSAQSGEGGWEATLAEVLLFDTIARPRPRMTALALKYGLTLASNYIESNGKIVFPTQNAAPFDERIFGVARHDLSALHQTFASSQSVSGTPSILHVRVGQDADGASLISQDGSFLIFGSNGASHTLSTSITPAGGTVRIPSLAWRIENTGFEDDVTLVLDPSAIDASINAAVLASDDTFMIDTIVYPLTTLPDGRVAITLIIPKDATRYLTFGQGTQSPP